VDIVKVLKTQDENYIRTMRRAGIKVRARAAVDKYCTKPFSARKLTN
jgi:hypothetical protein